MTDVTYEIVQHDGGWAYKVNGVFSESFPTHADALAAGRVNKVALLWTQCTHAMKTNPKGIPRLVGRKPAALHA
jgi:hypothetical protein